MRSSVPDPGRRLALALPAWLLVGLGTALVLPAMLPTLPVSDPILARHLPTLAGLAAASLATGRDRGALLGAALLSVSAWLGPKLGVHPVVLAAGIAGAATVQVFGPADRLDRAEAGLLASGGAALGLAAGPPIAAVIGAAIGLVWTAWRHTDPDLPPRWTLLRLGRSRLDASAAWELYVRIRSRLPDPALRRELHALAWQITDLSARRDHLQRELEELRVIAARATTARAGSLHALQLDAHRTRAEEHAALLQQELERAERSSREGLALLEEAHAAASVTAALGQGASGPATDDLLRRVRALGVQARTAAEPAPR
jgi:hypothetical protein